MPRGMLRRGLRTSSPSVVAASKPTKERMPKVIPSANPESPVGDDVGESGASVRPFAPPCARTIALRSTITPTSTANRIAAVLSEPVIPRNDRKTIRMMKKAEMMVQWMCTP